MSATQERTETTQDQVARLEARLQDGFTRIGEAMSKGVAVENWEAFWVQLLREYETLSDELAAHHAETVQAELPAMPRAERVEV